MAAFLPWLQAEEEATAKVEGQQDLAARWELVNGTAIAIEGAKLVLIPSEAGDLEELRVPQEWVDIPNWTADYYLAVQVNVDEGYVRIWGYTTHQNLKQGDFNQNDRTYSLTGDRLVGDLNALWVARELCPEEVTQAAVAPIAELASDRADKLVERLGDAAQLLPRLAVPFSNWAALLQNPKLRQRLAAARQGTPATTPILQWLKRGLSELSAESGWRRIEVSISGARGANQSAATADAAITSTSGLTKHLTIDDRPYELKILPLAEAGGWRFELLCRTSGCMIPKGFKLRLLTADLQSFEGNESVASQSTDRLTIDLYLDPGESLVWQIEPTPDDYQHEVLQF